MKQKGGWVSAVLYHKRLPGLHIDSHYSVPSNTTKTTEQRMSVRIDGRLTGGRTGKVTITPLQG